LPPDRLHLEPLFTQVPRENTSERRADETVKLHLNHKGKSTETTVRQLETEKEKLQGKWRAVEITNFGKQLPKEKVDGLQVIISGDKYRASGKDGRLEEDAISICVDAEPHEMNLRRTSDTEPHWQWTMLNIYKLEGDKLTICSSHPFGGPRPLEFKADGHWVEDLMVLERVKSPNPGSDATINAPSKESSK